METDFDNLKGKVIVISGASGSGKGTMIRKLLEKNPDFVWSVSATSRPMREGEVDGEDYYFLSEREFEQMIGDEEFFEWAYNHKAFYYGTPKAPILKALREGKTVVMEINYEGYLNVKKMLPEHVLSSVFILPPSEDVLRRRILERNEMSEQDLKNRLEYSLKKEMEHADMYDTQFEPVDGDIDRSFDEFEKVVLG